MKTNSQQAGNDLVVNPTSAVVSGLSPISLRFNPRDLFEMFPEALESIERNIKILEERIEEITRNNMPKFDSVIEAICNNEEPYEEALGVLARFWWLDNPVAVPKAHLEHLRKTLRFYQPVEVSGLDITPHMISNAKGRNIEDFLHEKLNRSGFVRCPFHNEKTGSCKINGNRFKCFGCGEFGDTIDWLMKTEGRSFADVIKSLQ